MLQMTLKLFLILTLSLQAQQPVINFVPCDCTKEQKALGLCQQLAKDLDNENTLLKTKIDVLTKQRDVAQQELEKAEKPGLLPWWMWTLIGASAGVATYAIIHK